MWFLFHSKREMHCFFNTKAINIYRGHKSVNIYNDNALPSLRLIYNEIPRAYFIRVIKNI